MKKIYERYIKKSVEEDLKSTMVFVGGPRQVGKTTFALNFLPEPSEKHPAYLNWDDLGARSSLLKGELPANQKCIILDEIHKFARWRNLIKGFYDTNRSEISFIILQDRQDSIITARAEIPYMADTIITGFILFPRENSTLPPQKMIFRHY